MLKQINYKIKISSCLTTKEKYLNDIMQMNCKVCLELPIYPLRTTTSEGYYCIKCLELTDKFDMNHIIQSSNYEKKLIDRLKINCLNLSRGCNVVISVKNFNELIEHEENCLKDFNLKDLAMCVDKKISKKCFKCGAKNVNLRFSHNCLDHINKKLNNELFISNEKIREKDKFIKENLEAISEFEINVQSLEKQIYSFKNENFILRKFLYEKSIVENLRIKTIRLSKLRNIYKF